MRPFAGCHGRLALECLLWDCGGSPIYDCGVGSYYLENGELRPTTQRRICLPIQAEPTTKDLLEEFAGQAILRCTKRVEGRTPAGSVWQDATNRFNDLDLGDPLRVLRRADWDALNEGELLVIGGPENIGRLFEGETPSRKSPGRYGLIVWAEAPLLLYTTTRQTRFDREVV